MPRYGGGAQKRAAYPLTGAPETRSLKILNWRCNNVMPEFDHRGISDFSPSAGFVGWVERLRNLSAYSACDVMGIAALHPSYALLRATRLYNLNAVLVLNEAHLFFHFGQDRQMYRSNKLV
jgi:hypothetical protein